MALTWRNVDAPDFSASLNGIRTFGDLFQGAVSTAERGLGQFDAAQDRRANNSFSMDLLKYQDPAQYKAALASGALFAGTDPNRLSAASIQAAGARAGDLLNQKTAEFGLTKDQYGFTRRQETDAKLDAATPLLAGAYSAARTGQGAFDAYMKANPALGALPYEQASGLAKGAIESEAQGVTIDGGRQNNTFGAKRFGWEETDRATQDAAESAYAEIAKNSFDGESAMTMLNGMNLPPKVYNAILGRIGGGISAGGGGSSGGSMPSGGGGGTSAGFDAVLGNGKFGTPPIPVSEMTGAQAIQFGRDTLIPATRNNAQLGLAGTNKGSSAMGMYQFTGETLQDYMPRVLANQGGINAKLTPENQDKLAEAIFNDSKGGNLKARWASLPDSTPGAYKNKPWSEMRQIIAAGEVGADPRALALGGVITKQGMTTNSMERNSAGAGALATSYAQSSQDNRAAGDVAGDLMSKPNFKGMTQSYVSQQISLVQAEAAKQGKTISTGVAADILNRSVTSSAWSRNLPGWLGGGDSVGNKIDSSQVSSFIKEYKQGAVDNAVVGNANSALAGQAAQAAQGKYDAAKARYDAAVAAQNRGVKVDLAPIMAQMNRASNALSGALSQNGSNRAVTSFNQPDAPPAITVRRTAGAQPVRVAANAGTGTRAGNQMAALRASKGSSPVAASPNMTTAQRQRLWAAALAK